MKLSIRNFAQLWIIVQTSLMCLTFLFGWFYYQETEKFNQLQILNIDLEKNISNIILLSYEEMYTPSLRTQTQWNITYQSALKKINDAHALITETRYQMLIDLLASTQVNFNNIRALSNQDNKSVFLPSITSSIYLLGSNVHRIIHQEVVNHTIAKNWFIFWLMMFAICMTLIPFIAYSQIKNKALTAIITLSESTNNMIENKFLEPITSKGFREIESLGNSIEALRTNLLNEIALKSELKFEIEKRIEIEQALNNTLEKLKENQTQMLQMEKLSAIGVMVGGVAHELNNPLMGVQNYIDYSIKHTDNEKINNILNKANAEVQRMKRLVTNMLIFSRVNNNPEKTVVNLAEIADRVLNVLQGEFKKHNVQINCNIASDISVVANIDGLQQVLTNLLSNAIFAVKNVNTPQITIAATRENNNLAKIIIEDNGQGIPKTLQHKIFDPFFTTKPVGEGTGLGLSISQEILQKTGSDLKLVKSTEQGTQFCFTLNTKQESITSTGG